VVQEITEIISQIRDVFDVRSEVTIFVVSGDVPADFVVEFFDGFA